MLCVEITLCVFIGNGKEFLHLCKASMPLALRSCLDNVCQSLATTRLFAQKRKPNLLSKALKWNIMSNHPQYKNRWRSPPFPQPIAYAQTWAKIMLMEIIVSAGKIINAIIIITQPHIGMVLIFQFCGSKWNKFIEWLATISVYLLNLRMHKPWLDGYWKSF